MKLMIPFFIINAASILSISEEEWTKFKIEYKKSYKDSKEDQIRFDIFKDNLNEINEHNKRFKEGVETYEKGINKFGDMTGKKFLDMYKLYPSETKIYNESHRNNVTEPADDAIDWREYGAVTSVKNQQKCGACWIFSALGALEGYYYRKHKKLISLSTQNVIDCIDDEYTCLLGGYPPDVFDYVKYHGINADENYPYEGERKQCRYNPSKNINIRFNVTRKINDEEDLKNTLTKNGPVVVCIYVGVTWRFYKQGVWYKPKCSEEVNHAMVLIGYGRENGQDYWLLKNSMGQDWGESGYIKIARNKHQNYCGIVTAAFTIY